jgi:hypothetical protein
MRRILRFLSVCLLCFPSAVSAGEFTDSASAFVVDFPAGWKAVKSDDPAMAVRLERGRSYFRLSRLDSELSDYYLKVRVKEQMESLAGKNIDIYGDLRETSIHGAAAVYYVSYDVMGDVGCTAYFTYNGTSYEATVRGLDDGSFRGVLASIRRPGEKLEIPKPRKIRVYGGPTVDTSETLREVLTDPIFSTAAVAASTSVPELSTAAGGVPLDAGVSVWTNALRKNLEFFAVIKPVTDPSIKPYFPRRPLDLRIWGALMALWLLGAIWARSLAKKFQNPKLAPPRMDVPSDYFFPFIVSRRSTLTGCVYNVNTRQKQRLLGFFESEHEIFCVVAVYACALFHILWSFLVFIGYGSLVTGTMLALPGGCLWASAPELFFAAPLLAGIALYYGRQRVLRIFDAQATQLMMETKQEGANCVVRDGKGEQVAKMIRTDGPAGRAWAIIDADNRVAFTIKDDYPATRSLRKLFGNLGGLLRSHYGIFAGEQRAGFVFLDPSSAHRFQIYLDFDFSRRTRPAQLLACILYIISMEKEPAYPWIF